MPQIQQTTVSVMAVSAHVLASLLRFRDNVKYPMSEARACVC